MILVEITVPAVPLFLSPVLHFLFRSGLISLEDVRIYLGEDFDEAEMTRNMRAISTREDTMVRWNPGNWFGLLCASVLRFGFAFDLI